MSSLIMPIRFPVPYSDESPISYLIRTAEVNSYKHITWLYNQDAPPFVLSPGKLFDQLIESSWTGFDKVTADVQAICRQGVRSLNISAMRFCPKCIQEEPYHRAKWYLAGSVVCLEHSCWLADSCPECHSPLKFRELDSIGYCSCGASLASDAVSAASESAIRYERFFSGLPPIDKDCFYFSSCFDGSDYSLSERVNLVNMLARWSLTSHEYFHVTGNFAGLNSFPSAKACIQSFADSWLKSEEQFHKYLDTLQHKICGDQKEGDELFRFFYKKIFRNLVHPNFQLIKDSIQTYMHDHWVHSIDRRNSLFITETIAKHKWLALQAASRELCIGKSVIKKGIESGAVRHQVKNGESRELVLVHRDDVIKLNQESTSYVNTVTAASLLGITKSQIYDLTNDGVLSRHPRPGFPPSGAYFLDELQGVMDSLNSRLSIVEHDLISLPDAIRKIGNGIKSPFVSLIKAIFSGEVSAQLDPNEIGFRRLKIDSQELRAWYLENTKEAAAEYFTMQTLRSHFQVSSDLIPQLVHKGLIHRVKKPSSAAHKFISIQAVNQFKERYVLLSKLSLSTSASSAALMKKFEANQIFPIDHDWEAEDQFVQKIYYRHDLLSIPDVQAFVSSMADWEYESF